MVLGNSLLCLVVIFSKDKYTVDIMQKKPEYYKTGIQYLYTVCLVIDNLPK
jgi:hypothetical protein